MTQALLPDEIEALQGGAMRAMGARDFAAAISLFQRLAAAEPGNISRWLGLATALRASGAPLEAIAALDGGLKSDPRHFLALLMKASIMDASGQAFVGEAYAIALAQAPDDALLDPPTLRAVARAREVSERHTQGLRDHLRTSLRDIEADTNPSEKRKLQFFCEDALRLRKRYQQEPVQFYYPGLPALEIYDRDLFPWMADFEAQTEAIKAELMGVIDKDFTGFTPYIEYPEHMPVDQWAELNHNPNWGAFHLIKGGDKVPGNASRCPQTLKALEPLPQPDLPGRGPVAMFSALKPHTHIPAHTGISNTRLVVHLPLIVPDNCRFRVGNEVWPWRVGECFAFDDTLEHEAWNDSDQVRIVLIVDVWSPFLNATERAGITAAMAAMDTFKS
jgi:aspartate beta-hydroxylase